MFFAAVLTLFTHYYSVGSVTSGSNIPIEIKYSSVGGVNVVPSYDEYLIGTSVPNQTASS
jgi:hypothetical protein